MKPTEATVPEHMRATCISCEQTRFFKAAEGDAETESARFECKECGHKITLLLNPEKTPVTV